MTWREVHTLYGMPARTTPLNLQPRYNGCPTQDFAACRLDERGARAITKLRWGLIPAWAKDAKMGARLINARSETVHEKPAFRAAFRRRCLVCADGWFEWKKDADGKQPWFIAAADRAPVSFAALWERWEKGDEPLETFAIVTTAAAPALAEIHHRQPSLIEADDFEEWLDPGTGTERLLSLARRASEGPFDHWRVSKRVNSSRNEGADLVRPLEG